MKSQASTIRLLKKEIEEILIQKEINRGSSGKSSVNHSITLLESAEVFCPEAIEELNFISTLTHTNENYSEN